MNKIEELIMTATASVTIDIDEQSAFLMAEGYDEIFTTKLDLANPDGTPVSRDKLMETVDLIVNHGGAHQFIDQLIFNECIDDEDAYNLINSRVEVLIVIKEKDAKTKGIIGRREANDYYNILAELST